jgi:hypothetical protein
MRISRSSAIWKSAYAILCKASEPHGYITVEDFMSEYNCSREEAEERFDTMVLKHAGDPICPECEKPVSSNGQVVNGSTYHYGCARFAAAGPQSKDDGEKSPVEDICHDCGADIDACGCKNVAVAGPEWQPFGQQLVCQDCGGKFESLMDFSMFTDAPGDGPMHGLLCSDCARQYMLSHGIPTEPVAASDEMQPGPEMAQLLEQFSQEVYQKRLDELKYEELAALRDMLVTKRDEQPVYEIDVPQ